MPMAFDNFFQSAPYPLLLPAYYARFASLKSLEALYCSKRLQLPIFGDESFASYKTSDTLFILGSGSSINKIPEERWAKIKQSDSFGFNFWLFHEHVPTFYTMEAIGNKEVARKPVARRFLEMARSRRDYSDVPKLVSDVHLDRLTFVDAWPTHFKSKLSIVRTLPTVARSPEELKYALHALAAVGLFRRDQQPKWLFKYRATLSMLISFGIRLDYKNIVLCGIDLRSPDYFYENTTLYPHAVGFRSSKSLSTHATLVPHKRMMSIDEVVWAMAQICAGDTKLFVENPSSALFPEIPLFSEQQWSNLGIKP